MSTTETRDDEHRQRGVSVIFLDCDGVLNDHRKWPNKFAPLLYENVQHLNYILEACPDVQIVLSSAWRYRFSNEYVIEALLCCFGVNAFDRIHGLTDLDPVDHTRPYDDREWWERMGLRWRGEQICEYAERYRLTRWAVLDDLPLGVDHLFQTEPHIGLTREIAERVVAHFAHVDAAGQPTGGGA